MLRGIWRLVTPDHTDSESIVSMFVPFPKNLGESELRENQSRSRYRRRWPTTFANAAIPGIDLMRVDVMFKSMSATH